MAPPSAFKPALIVVDMQNDFCPPDGSLPVEDARLLANPINHLVTLPFAYKVATQDWHPQSHISFASNHSAPDNVPFTSWTTLTNPKVGEEPKTKEQRLWPDHCVQGSEGAEIIAELASNVSKKVDLVVKKGMDEGMEMYSVFANAFGHMDCCPKGVTHDLASMFKERGITHVYNVGIAGDYCLRATAVDAARAGFVSYVVEEGVKCVDPGEGWNEALKDFGEHNVSMVKIEGKEVGWVRDLKA